MERCGGSAGAAFEATGAVRFPARKYQAPPTITTTATIPAISGKGAERGFGLSGFSKGSAAAFAWAGTPT